MTADHIAAVREELIVNRVTHLDYLADKRVVDEGVEQTARYVDHCAAEAGHLVVIDQRDNRSWEEKISRTRRRSAHLRRGGGAVPVAVWGM